MKTWQDLEANIKQLAQAIWSAPATAETISGVKCDCVIRHRPDYWILIEISKSNTLTKLRTDLAKFATCKPALMAKGIFAECHFVHEDGFPSLSESAEGHNVEVHSANKFFSKYLGSEQYLYERKLRAFGSAVDPDNGEIDSSSYVPIKYYEKDGTTLSIQDIAEGLKTGRKYVLLGEFGSGKSRCLMEVFKALCATNERTPPIAINLRDNWGYKKFNHIIQNHLDNLGLGDFVPPIVRSCTRGMHPILLDGFDELGSQSWSGNVVKLSELRKGSMQGVRDLIQECRHAGVLITGREHYFNSEEEMLECLGLDNTDVSIIHCPSEFSEQELQSYISQRTSLSQFPSWLPKKPLLCQLLTRIDQTELEDLVTTDLGETNFFTGVLDAICKREANIHPTIFKDSLKKILLELSTLSRTKDQNLGPISTAEISAIFEKVTGSAPIDESAIVLQRLPYLGRAGSGSADRIFIDEYAVDGLRALALISYFFDKNEDIKYQKWKHPLNFFGYKTLGNQIKINDESIKYFRTLEAHGNTIACADFIGGTILESEVVDFRGLAVTNAKISTFDLSGKSVSNLSISSSEITELTIDNCTTESFEIRDCIFSKVIGCSSKDGLPDYVIDCDAIDFEDVLTVSRISDLKISNKHKTLLSIIKKLFFQPGRGRREEALLRGTEKYWDDQAAASVLKLMLTEQLVEKIKGDDGLVYKPARSKTPRARKIMSKLGNCEDPLWDKL